MFFHIVYKSGQIFLPFCHNSRVWQTNRQTEFSSLDRVCIPCSAVKILFTIMYPVATIPAASCSGEWQKLKPHYSSCYSHSLDRSSTARHHRPPSYNNLLVFLASVGRVPLISHCRQGCCNCTVLSRSPPIDVDRVTFRANCSMSFVSRVRPWSR